VIPPQQEKVLRIFDFVTKQEQDCFQGLLAPVDIVSKEEVVGGRRESAHLKETYEVSIL
jgi:hypothetical protein